MKKLRNSAMIILTLAALLSSCDSSSPGGINLTGTPVGVLVWDQADWDEVNWQ